MLCEQKERFSRHLLTRMIVKRRSGIRRALHERLNLMKTRSAPPQGKRAAGRAHGESAPSARLRPYRCSIRIACFLICFMHSFFPHSLLFIPSRKPIIPAVKHLPIQFTSSRALGMVTCPVSPAGRTVKAVA